MKLFRYGTPGAEKPGVVNADGEHCELRGFQYDYDEAFFAGDGLNILASWIESNPGSCIKMDKVGRFGPPVKRPSKLICIGLNYSDHAKESNMTLPAEPVVFFKSTSAIVGPNDDLIIPKNSKKTDWEVELAV